MAEHILRLVIERLKLIRRDVRPIADVIDNRR